MSRTIKRIVVLVHLYLGLLLSLVFAIWFVSGIAMVYYRTPVLDDNQKAAFEKPLPQQITFEEPSSLAALATHWTAVDMLSAAVFEGRPLYRWRLDDGRWQAGWADDGARAGFGPEELEPAAARWFAGTDGFRYSGEFDENTQWTFFRSVRGHLPLHRFTSGSAFLREEIYFSSQTGEPLISTTPSSRLLYFLGPGLHYASFYPIRNRNQLWRDIVNWTSGAGVVLAVTGIIIGLWRFRWTPSQRSQRRIPFTRFWMRWHHIVGLAVAVPTFTFVLSGLFSMNPGAMFPSIAISEPLMADYRGSRPSITSLPPAHAGLDSLDFRTHRVDYLQRDSAFHLLAHSGDGQRQRVGLDADSWRAQLPFSQATLIAHIESLLDTGVAEAQWLESYDNYYYSRKERYRPLPVLRLILDDAQGAWLYIEPTSGELLRQTERGSRARRWLYNGLHSLDPQFLLDRPRLWTTVIWSLSLGGLFLSVTGVVLSWRWLKRRFASPGPARARKHHFAPGLRT